MKQKVLIFIDWFYPGFRAGGPLTSNVNITAHLKNEFDFYIITRDTDYCESAPYSNVTSDEWTLLDDGVYIYYFSKDKLNRKNLRMVAASADCPIWYINGIYSFYFSILPLYLSRQLKPEKTIVSARGMLSPHAFKFGGLKKSIFINVMKCSGMYKPVCFHATNDEEAGYIKDRIGCNTLVYSIANLPRKISPVAQKLKKKEAGRVVLISLARISPEKNTLYAIECLQKCTQPVVFDLYGQAYDIPYWEACQEEIKKLPSLVTVNYHGGVNPESLKECLAQADFLFLPSTGENFGHAILESFMNGCPVIISNKTPWQNLQKKGVGWDLPLNDQSAFTKVVDDCAIMDQVVYQTMVENALQYAKEIVHDESVLNDYIKMFNLKHTQNV